MAGADDFADAVFRGIFKTAFAPIKLGYRAIKISSEQAQHAELEKQNDANRQRRDEKRQKQLDALRDALPPNPPERMRAAIHLNEYKVPRFIQKARTKLIGDKSFDLVEDGEDMKFSVDMILELTEADRAIIKQNELDDIVIEDIPLYTDYDVADAKQRTQERLDGTKNLLSKAIDRNISEDVIASMKHERFKVRIGDLVLRPYTRAFDSPHEAKEYSDKLKTKYLPELRKLLDRYSQHKPNETLEF